ncbi:MAG: hypothetical protein WCI03_01385 [bacterium]
MTMRSVILFCVMAGLAAGMVCRAQTPVPDERGLWQVWAASTNAGDAHAAVVAACREFRTKSPQDSLGVVIAGLEAWHQLKMGKTNEASALLETMLSVPENATYLQVASADMARGWLTRLDREKVRGALKKIYARDIEFPSSLESIKALKLSSLPPFTDRWGKPWVYRQESLLKGMNTQQYVLESTRLGVRSDLGKALAVPYASGINIEPVRLAPGSTDTVEFTTAAGKSAFLQAGGTLNSISVAYLGGKIIVLADENHWRVVLKPQ